jgi:hypothetical protein
VELFFWWLSKRIPQKFPQNWTRLVEFLRKWRELRSGDEIVAYRICSFRARFQRICQGETAGELSAKRVANGLFGPGLVR